MTPQELLETYHQAFDDKDWSTFANCLSEDFNMFADKGRRQNKAELVRDLGKDTWQTVKRELNNARFTLSADGNMALATYNLVYDGHEGDPARPLHIEFLETMIFRKEAGEWKILHSHYSML